MNGINNVNLMDALKEILHSDSSETTTLILSFFRFARTHALHLPLSHTVTHTDRRETVSVSTVTASSQNLQGGGVKFKLLTALSVGRFERLEQE